MRFTVHHETIYRYAQPVALASHVLRFVPRPEGVRLLSRELTIEPAPVFRQEAMDAFGNFVTRVNFNGLSDLLRIESRFELETLAAPSASGFVAPKLPWALAPGDANAAYLEAGPVDVMVGAFTYDLARRAGANALEFLDLLNQTLYTQVRHEIRPDGAAMRPEETLAVGAGACRDVTMLFLAACRCLGIPARFVSGYQAEADTPDGKRHLHAWPQVHLPGLGWRGYDPTHGLAVSEGHVALSVAPDQAATMPVEGGYFGAAVDSTLSYAVRITTG
jgi:transglutaminase-like putative cysteine protease